MGLMYISSQTDLHRVADNHTKSFLKISVVFAKILRCEFEVFNFRVWLSTWAPYISSHTGLHKVAGNLIKPSPKKMSQSR